MSCKLAVLLSDNGLKLQALIDRLKQGDIDATINFVVASDSLCEGLKIADSEGIQTLTLSEEAYEIPAVADRYIAAQLQQQNIDYIICAGYSKKVYAPLLEPFQHRIFRIHPSLLPSFPHGDTVASCRERGVKLTGVSVVMADYDDQLPPIVLQRALPIEESWSYDELQAALDKLEQQTLPELLPLLAQGRITYTDAHKVRIN